MTCLEDENASRQIDTINALARCKTLPEPILLTLVVKLESRNLEVQKAAIYTLRCQSPKWWLVAGKALQALGSRINHEDSEVQQATLRILQNVQKLPENICQELLRKALDNKDDEVQAAALRTLEKLLDLPENILQELAARINGKAPDEEIVAEFLKGRPDLPESII